MKLFIPIMGTIAGVGGWFMLNLSFTVGIILIIFGLFTSVISILGTYLQDKQIQDITFTQAVLYHKTGMGNVFKNQLQHEFKKQGYSKDAIRLLELALKIDPDDVGIMEQLSAALALYLNYCQFLDGQLSKDKLAEVRRVKQLCIAAKKKNPNAPLFYVTVGMIWDIEGKHNEAIKMFKKVGKLGIDPYWRLYLATSLLMSGKYEESLREMEKAKKENVKGTIVDFYYARSLAACGQYEKSLTFYLPAINNGKGNVQLYCAYAKALHMTGNFLSAGKHFASLFVKTVRFRPKIAMSFLARASNFFILAMVMGTSHKLWKVTRFIPLINWLHIWLLDPSEPYKTLFALRCEKGYAGEAEVLARKQLAILPKSPYAMSDLAICVAHNGNTKLAHRLIDRAIELKPNNVVFQWNKEQIDLWAKGIRGSVRYADKKGKLYE